MEQRYLLRLVVLWYIFMGSGESIQIFGNCTCKTSDGDIYSLMPFRRTRFVARGKKYPGYWYTYNPCTPADVGQNDPDADPHKICRDVGICKYAEIEKPREYIEVGVQTGVSCDRNKEGNIELVYKTNDPSIDTPYSRVVLYCDKSSSYPDFQPEDEDKYIFNFTSRCGCPNLCSPSPTTPGPHSSSTPSSGPKTTSPTPKPTTSVPGTTPPGPKPTSFGPETTSSGPNTTSVPGTPSPGDLYSDWELKILLPSLAAFIVVVICFACLWRRLPVIREALLCRRCPCYEYREPPREEKIVPVTETSPLIKKQVDNQAVEHEDAGVKGKFKQPVQEEEGDVGEEKKFDANGHKTVVV